MRNYFIAVLVFAVLFLNTKRITDTLLFSKLFSNTNSIKTPATRTPTEGFCFICLGHQKSSKDTLLPQQTTSLENQVRNTIKAKESELSSKYKVVIAHEGDIAYPEFYSGRAMAGVQARGAYPYELESLEYALIHSQPSQLLGKNPGSLGIRIYFLKDRLCCGAIADWALSNGKPAIFIEPYDYEERSDNLTKAFIHELAHNAAYRMGFDPREPNRWKLITQLGWRSFYNSGTGEQVWAIQSSESNYYYKYKQDSSKWVRCDNQGHILNAGGVRVKGLENADLRTPKEMANSAIIRPATFYFLNPMEMFADALMTYRLSASSRKNLLLTCPALYSIVKTFDQEELDKTYGKSACVRSTDGIVVAQTSKALQDVISFEESKTIIVGKR